MTLIQVRADLACIVILRAWSEGASDIHHGPGEWAQKSILGVLLREVFVKSAKLLIAFVFAALMLLAPAVAQTVPFRVNVPFNFTVGDQRMPAGVYRVAILHDVVLQVVRMDGSSVVKVLTTHISGGPNQDPTPSLVFHRYGDHLYLAEVWTGSTEVGHQLSTTASELEYVRAAQVESAVVVGARLPNR